MHIITHKDESNYCKQELLQTRETKKKIEP